MRQTILILMMMLIGLSACSKEDWIEKLSTPEERALSLRSLKALQSGNFGAVDAMSRSELREEVTPEIYDQVRGMIPPGEPRLQTVAANSHTADGVTTTLKSFNYEMGSGDRWAIVQITLQTSPGRTTVAGFRAYPMEQSPIAAQSFSFEGKGALHYFWLLTMVAAVVTTIAGIVMVIRTPDVRRKWLWVIGCLFSFVTFSLNWNTGEMGVAPFYFLIFGAGGGQAGPLSPWIFQFAIPVVAITFLIRKAMGVYRIDLEKVVEPF
ncbi:hypothetical protein P1X14_02575 [Sphingomonas sp. AOB5]|uniref:hypothetical protein n=1 Tax=Sphingomonas sp. AOB5 TaxID=3034017 RepID=UPI0023F67701|nr:hypothetical protein [Sphingomonas sp. AOB5]MDF7774120.1 hypothetical protein [Sphingomonas sp. AOB5]